MKVKLLADHAKAYANQCTKDIDGDVSWHWMEYYTEKFAELIVKKVLDEVAFRAFVSGDTAWSDDAYRHWVELEFGFGRLAKLKKK